ncbi:MAG: zf-TFIIB domain-containing protein [Alphaproteobacteria bacterium]|nr:zf-TFIIB domain-containing protein [Alphaproteobacteria bacterium]MCB9695883.1 zf-TFIIB domain-containing protein [Alphaproteobacteria bacterium]
MQCPRCSAEMAPARVGPVKAHGCPSCGGGTLLLRDLEAALAALEPATSFDPAVPMAAVPDAGGGLGCPSCGRAMSHGGFMEQPLVQIDRCTACMLLFVDVGELEAMAEQRMRSDRQRGLRRSANDAVLDQLKWLVSNTNV